MGVGRNQKRGRGSIRRFGMFQNRVGMLKGVLAVLWLGALGRAGGDLGRFEDAPGTLWGCSGARQGWLQALWRRFEAV